MAQQAHPMQGARELRGWSAADLARHAGVSEAAVSRIEARKRRPNAATVAKLARALGLPLADLLEPWVGEDE
jgi:transcriptional regulator with XRE-family HTH domain